MCTIQRIFCAFRN